MEGAQQIEQDPCLPLFAHCISVNAAWAPADPCLPLLSDLFPLIFPAGKWTILSQWVGRSSPGSGAMGSAG